MPILVFDPPSYLASDEAWTKFISSVKEAAETLSDGEASDLIRALNTALSASGRDENGAIIED